MNKLLTELAQSALSFSEEVGSLIVEKPLTFVTVANVGLAVGVAIVFVRGY